MTSMTKRMGGEGKGGGGEGPNNNSRAGLLLAKIVAGKAVNTRN